MGRGPFARRVTVGNLLVRLIGSGIVLPFSEQATSALLTISNNPAQLVVDAHIAFNLILAAVVLPLLSPFCLLMRRILPEAVLPDHGTCHLDAGILDKPTMAPAAAARETLRIGDCVASMLETNLEALRKNDTKRSAALDDEVDRLNSAVKLYLAKLNRTALASKDQQRSAEIISYAINLEHVGDIVDRNLRQLVEKKICTLPTNSRPSVSFTTNADGVRRKSPLASALPRMSCGSACGWARSASG